MMAVTGNAIEYLQDFVLVCVGNMPLITLSWLFPEPELELDGLFTDTVGAAMCQLDC
jgi:hypothetical protein